MRERKSKRIQHRRLQCNRLNCTVSFLFIFFTAPIQFVFAQTATNLPTIKETPTERIHSLEIAQINGLSDKYKSEYIELLAFEETKEIAHFRLAQIYSNSENWSKAEIHAMAALSLNPENSNYCFLAIKILEKQFRYQDAWKIHQYLIKSNPRYISRYYEAISNCLKREDYQSALQLIQLYRFHFGYNEYAHRTQLQCYFYLNPKFPEKHYSDSILIENENYLLLRPKDFTSWVAFQINQITKGNTLAIANVQAEQFYNKMLEFQKWDSKILSELEELRTEFPFLQKNINTNRVFSILQNIISLNEPQPKNTLISNFQRSLVDTSITLLQLDSMNAMIQSSDHVSCQVELSILIGNQYFIRGEFRKALLCYRKWTQKEYPVLYFENVDKPNGEASRSEIENHSQTLLPNNAIKKTKLYSEENSALSIYNRFVICLYKNGLTDELNQSINWYEENYPFILNEATTLITALNLQSNKKWSESVSVWNKMQVKSSSFQDGYFGLIDSELHAYNQIQKFKEISFSKQIEEWIIEGKLHPSLARVLIIEHNQAMSSQKK